MNKIQKILWSIFSGAICMIYKPSYGADAKCWAVVTQVKVDSCTNIPSSVILSYCYNGLGSSAPGSRATQCACHIVVKNTPLSYDCDEKYADVRSEMSRIYFSTEHHHPYETRVYTNICDKKYEYFPFDPQLSPPASACSKCPTRVGSPSDYEFIRAEQNGYVGSPQLLDNSTIFNPAESEVYINICSDRYPDDSSMGGSYFTVYKSIPNCIVSTKKQTASDCYTIPNGSYTDDTGTYSYKDDKCEYTE